MVGPRHERARKSLFHPLPPAITGCLTRINAPICKMLLFRLVGPREDRSGCRSEPHRCVCSRGWHGTLGDEGKAVGCVPPTALLFEQHAAIEFARRITRY